MNVSVPTNVAVTRIVFPNARYLDAVGVVDGLADPFEGGVDAITTPFDVIFWRAIICRSS